MNISWLNISWMHLQARNSSVSRRTVHELDGAGRTLSAAVQCKRQGRTNLRFQRQCLQVNLRNETPHLRVRIKKLTNLTKMGSSLWDLINCRQGVVKTSEKFCQTTSHCKEICWKASKAVCGSDGHIYASSCQMKVKNCGYVVCPSLHHYSFRLNSKNPFVLSGLPEWAETNRLKIHSSRLFNLSRIVL